MSETEIVALEGFQTEQALRNLSNSLNAVIRRGQGRILVACNAGMKRSQLLKEVIPDELLANKSVEVGFSDLSNFDRRSPDVIVTPDDASLKLAKNGSVRPFNRLVLAVGNFGEREQVDLTIIKPLMQEFRNRLTQVITVDLRG